MAYEGIRPRKFAIPLDRLIETQESDAITGSPGHTVKHRTKRSCRHAITRAPSPITSTVYVFSIRSGWLQEADVTCCAGWSIVADAARERSGRHGRPHRTLTVPQHESMARAGGFPMSATPAF